MFGAKVWMGLGLAVIGIIGVVALVTVSRLQTADIPRAPGPALTVEAGKFPHHVFDAVLKRFVDDQGKVDYKGLSASPQELYRYLDAIARYAPHSHPDLFPKPKDQLAYYINAYNAYVLFGILNRPDLHSVNDDKVTFFVLTRYRLGNEAMSLHHLENDVIRARFYEPRIHFALNCASGGCPRLPQEAFVPSQLESQLSRETKRFCQDPQKVDVDKTGQVRLSQIFEWYAKDFESSKGAIAFCRNWGRMDLPADATPQFIPYDWSLNHQAGRALWQ